MMTEHEQSTKLRRTFENRVSKGAFKKIDDELRVIGKFAQIAILDTGGIDVWIRSPDLTPLGTRKLNNLCTAVSTAIPEAQIQNLDGEAWFQTEYLPDSLFKVLGVRRKMVFTDERKKAMAERLKAARASKNGLEGNIGEDK